jgi:hypothetical protein
MQLKTWILAASTLAVAGLSWNLLAASGNDGSPAGAASQTESSPRTHERTPERPSLSTPRWNGPSRAGHPGTGHEESTANEASTAVEPATTEPVPLELVLEQKFEAGGQDLEWTQTAAGEARDALADALPDGSWLDHLECRGSLCRVEIRHRKEDGHTALMSALMQGPPRWMGPGSFSRVRDPSGGESTLAYLGRPDSDFEEGSIWRTDAR